MIRNVENNSRKWKHFEMGVIRGNGKRNVILRGEFRDYPFEVIILTLSTVIKNALDQIPISIFNSV